MSYNTKHFIEKAKEVHSNKYNYSLVNYVNNYSKVKIICPIHGEFEQSFKLHINKSSGCPKCANNIKFTNKIFIEKAKEIHSDKYDYSLVKYENMKTKINIICPTHGVFEQRPTNHIDGHGCKICSYEINSYKLKLDKHNFIDKAKKTHGDKYDYSLVNYVNSNTKVKIICPIHGEFEQSPDNHFYGKNCIKCSKLISKKEKELTAFINSLNVDLIEGDRKILNGKELDIIIPSHNIAIEFDGLYWHSELYKDKNYHLNKTELCEKQGIQLIHVFEDEWLYKQDIVKSRLKNLLGLTENKIFARKCVIKEVLSKESKEFLDDNHIQGNVNSKIKLGLYYNDELVSIMTFGGLRKNMGQTSKENNYELLRFCNKLNTNVIGGAGKLLKYFINNYKPVEIISYADRRWSIGNLYNTLGFDYIHDSKPNYWYVNNDIREYRFAYRKDVLVKEGFDSSKSEHEIMKDRGIYRIYDCGTQKYKLIL